MLVGSGYVSSTDRRGPRKPRTNVQPSGLATVTQPEFSSRSKSILQKPYGYRSVSPLRFLITISTDWPATYDCCAKVTSTRFPGPGSVRSVVLQPVANTNAHAAATRRPDIVCFMIYPPQLQAMLVALQFALPFKTSRGRSDKQCRFRIR